MTSQALLTLSSPEGATNTFFGVAVRTSFYVFTSVFCVCVYTFFNVNKVVCIQCSVTSSFPHL